MSLFPPLTGPSPSGVNPIKASNMAQLFYTLGLKNPNSLAFALSVSDLETGLGTGYNNFGSVYDPSDPPPCAPPNVEVTDTDINGNKYQGCLKGYRTKEDGAGAFLYTLFRGKDVRAAAERMDYDKAVAFMRGNSYFVAPLKVYQNAVRIRSPYYVKLVGAKAPSSLAGSGNAIALGAMGVALLGSIAYGALSTTEGKTDVSTG